MDIKDQLKDIPIDQVVRKVARVGGSNKPDLVAWVRGKEAPQEDVKP